MRNWPDTLTTHHIILARALSFPLRLALRRAISSGTRRPLVVALHPRSPAFLRFNCLGSPCCFVVTAFMHRPTVQKVAAAPRSLPAPILSVLDATNRALPVGWPDDQSTSGPRSTEGNESPTYTTARLYARYADHVSAFRSPLDAGPRSLRSGPCPGTTIAPIARFVTTTGLLTSARPWWAMLALACDRGLKRPIRQALCLRAWR